MDATERERLVDNAAEKMRGGKSREQMVEKFRKKYPPESVSDAELISILADAQRKLKEQTERREDHPAEAVAEQAPVAVADYSAALRAKLAEVEAAEAGVPTELIERLAARIRGRVSDANLEGFNRLLAARKCGAITFEDVAWIAARHRVAIMDSQERGDLYRDTAPVERLTKASVDFGYRESPFANLQVKFARDILEAVGFTKSTAREVWRGKANSDNRSAKWSLSNDPYWTSAWADITVGNCN